MVVYFHIKKATNLKSKIINYLKCNAQFVSECAQNFPSPISFLWDRINN